MENKPVLRGGSSAVFAYDDPAFVPSPEQQIAMAQPNEIAIKVEEMFKSFFSDPPGEVCLFWASYHNQGTFPKAIKNLFLLNDKLRDVDPFDRDPSNEVLRDIISEAASNPAYKLALHNSGEVHTSIIKIIEEVAAARSAK